LVEDAGPRPKSKGKVPELLHEATFGAVVLETSTAAVGGRRAGTI